MNEFRTTLIVCQQCNRRIMVRPIDAERGSIICSHAGCGALNSLQTAFRYDDRLVNGLPGFGQLTYLDDPNISYPLQFGPNVIGTADSCTIVVNRFIHNGRCYISRRHCTLNVTFDSWSGQLRYQLQDGTVDPLTRAVQSSLNGTRLNDIPLRKTEIIDVTNQGVITLGGTDRFILTSYSISPAMLDTYKIGLAYNPDRTQ